MVVGAIDRFGITNLPNGKWRLSMYSKIAKMGKTRIIYITKDTLEECRQLIREIEQQKKMGV